jgi:hypothetical protein
VLVVPLTIHALAVHALAVHVVEVMDDVVQDVLGERQHGEF